MSKVTGRLVVMRVAIGKPTDNPTSLTFLTVGAMRGKNIEFSWDTVDATADNSPDFTKEELVTFKTVTISGDGVYDDAVSSNQDTLENHVISPGAATDFQPHAWVDLIYPNGKTFRGPFLFKKWAIDAPYGDVLTFSTDATSAGAVTIIPA
jgi:predicted secreted protein